MSSGSESDEDFVPGEPEQLSEEESADEETDQQFETELKEKATKRKLAADKKTKKKRRVSKKKAIILEPKEEEEKEPEPQLNPEEEKKKEDDLWAKFLDGTDTKTKSPLTNHVTSNTTASSVNSNNTTPIQKNVNKGNDEKEREKRIFEFAGETIVVENNVIKEKIPSKSTNSSESPGLPIPSRSRSSGGLASFVGKLNKKNTLSTLEKSKLDWDTFKKQEGVEEEIQSHNKGKHGYLDRQDFLERSDMKQFELERDLRMSRRSNR